MTSKDKFNKAKAYIKSNARPLDRALYEFEFNNSSPQTVLDILRNYQNDDGGFGRALEPDFRTDSSSVLATTVALQYINELNLSTHDRMINRAISFLVKETRYFKEGSPLKTYWSLVPIEQDQSLHAPWWNREDIKSPEIEDWPNPSVEVISYLQRYSEFVPQSLLEDSLLDLHNYLKLKPKLTGFVYYKFLCFKRLLPNVSKELQGEIFRMIDRTLENTNFLDDQNFEEIKIQWLVTEKSSYLYQKYHDKIKKLFKNEVNRLGEDGGSHPKWKWGEEKLWKEVEREWAGKCTIGLLVSLKYCDLINLLA
jgi:hypothetical protein